MNASDLDEFTDEELDQLCWRYWWPMVEMQEFELCPDLETGLANAPEYVP